MSANFTMNRQADTASKTGLVVQMAQLNEIFADVRARAGTVRALSAELVQLGQRSPVDAMPAVLATARGDWF